MSFKGISAKFRLQLSKYFFVLFHCYKKSPTKSYDFIFQNLAKCEKTIPKRGTKLVSIIALLFFFFNIFSEMSLKYKNNGRTLTNQIYSSKFYKITLLDNYWFETLSIKSDFKIFYIYWQNITIKNMQISLKNSLYNIAICLNICRNNFDYIL